MDLEILEDFGQLVILVTLESAEINVKIIVNEIGKVTEITVICRSIAGHPWRWYLN